MKTIVVLLVVIAITTSADAQVFKNIFGKKEKQEVESLTGTLTLHPDSVFLKKKDGEILFCFLDAINKCLFIGSSRIYDSVSAFLPVRVIEGRVATIQGTQIDPFSQFTKDDMDKLSKTLGVNLNTYKVAKIFNYGLKEPAAKAVTPTVVSTKSLYSALVDSLMAEKLKGTKDSIVIPVKKTALPKKRNYDTD